MFILAATVKLNMTQLKKNVFAIVFFIPLENKSDVMEDTTRVLLLVCCMSLSAEVIFQDVANKIVLYKILYDKFYQMKLCK